MKKIFLVAGAILSLLFAANAAYASIGVGVGVGKINVDKALRPGSIYELPSVPVLNTGDEPSGYEMSVEYHEGVREKRPAREWVMFEPKDFDLDPGGVMNVKVILTLPVKAEPGDYFAYLEAHPVKKSAGEGGGVSIGIAAASKLYFKIAPANFLQAIYYRASGVIVRYKPIAYAILAFVFFFSSVFLIKKYLKFEISVKK